MAKKKENKEILKASDVVGSEIPVFNQTSFSIVNTGPKKYAVVSINFDQTTGQAGEYKVLADDLDLYEAQHQFKVAVDNAGLFDPKE